MSITKTEKPARIKAPVASSRDGTPLSMNRAPAADIAPWIARIYTTAGAVSGCDTLECAILADTPIVRVLLEGEWTAQTADGLEHHGRRALYFGPQSHCMPVSICGQFRTVGIALQAGANTALGGPAMESMLDRILPYEATGASETNLLARFGPADTPETMMDALEDCARQMIAERGAAPPDPIAAAFERATFLDPGQPIKTFAAEHDISVRQVERIVRRDFGVTPKFAMRRARALDLAAELKGVAEREEAEELALRYFDQSHLTRDFLEFFGMTPMRFLRRDHPLLTMTMEARQARRLELVGRIAEGQPRPWE